MTRNQPTASSEKGGGKLPALGRRPFLKGASTLGAASGLLGGFTNVNAEPFTHAEDVPETPDDGATVRHFDVSAISLDIQYSQTGIHQPNGAMFVLDENKEEVRRVEGMEPGSDPATRLIEPLVIRANEGDIVEITFQNELEERCSIHQTGLPYEAETSDGLAVGYNPDTTVAPGETITYRWYANRLGTFFFQDGATPAFTTYPDRNPGNVHGLSRGLFGSVVVEPEDATWTNPRTGEPLSSGTRADVHVPGGTDHREFIIHYHDPQGVVTADGEEPTWPGTDNEQSTHAINYRGATTGMRIDEKPDCEDCEDPVTFYSSWVHGDPGGGDLVYEGYVGDPTKFVAVGAQLEENHVHHLHGHRWQEARGPEGAEGDTIDSQSLGVGTAYEAYLTPAYGADSSYPDRTFEEAFEIGAGGSHNAPGDYLFHCHLFPHYAEGMNGIFRLNDKEKADLVKLSNNEPPIPADSSRPSWQEIVGTTVEERGSSPAKPPGENREPNETEEEHLTPLVEGAPYVDPCIEPNRTVEYETVALPANIVYNDSGDHDPEGRIFMLESARISYDDDRPDETFDYSDDVQKVRDGEMNPEPMVIRANVGDCVEITVKNELPQPVSHHIHFVSFDPLGSDSTMTGYNYDSGAEPGGSRTYRWYADEEGTIFFHDHMVGVEFGMHGTFATLVVEPEGSEWTDPYSGEPIASGAQAMIDPPETPAFREQTLLYQDFAQLVDRDGEYVTEGRQHNENEGVMAINYRNAPYYHRDDDDPAYVFSSARHGDPETPVLEAYEGDPVRIRLAQAAYEEQHNFSCHGLRMDRQGLTDAGSAPQLVGTSEGFTFGVMATRIPDRNDRNDEVVDPNGNAPGAPNAPDAGRPLDNPNGLPVTDFLCGSTLDSDLWNGMWGLIRVWGSEVDHLQPLPGTDGPDGAIDDEELREMGHPAVHSDFSWSDHGQRAKLYYGESDDRAFPPDRDARQNGGVGKRPPKPPSPGDPCPDDAPVRSFDVCALRSDVQYNDYGDHDPYGIVYALSEDVHDIEHGLKNPEPLIVRANEGDCIELTLKNRVFERDDVHFQADLITGEPDEVLGEDPSDFYHPEGRLIRDVHGTINDGIVRRGRVRDPDCVVSEPITVDLEEQTASVTVTVEEGCEDVELSLAIYRKPSAPSVFDPNAHQHLADAETRTLDAGTHTFTVDLPGQTHPLARADAEFPESLRMSMHPHKLRYDAQGSDGATVGFNYDQTVAPGEEITYRWYADDEFGSLVLWDMADTRNHWHHGAFGKLIVEPEGSAYLDPETGAPLRNGAGDSAMIVSPEETFREFAVLMSDGMDIINPSGECIVPDAEDEHFEEMPRDGPDGHPNHGPCNQFGDAEDHGLPAVNYRSEPFSHRLKDRPAVHEVYSSAIHGDPNTPVFTAFLDEPVVFRVSLAGSKSRGSSFHLSNHHWPRYQDVDDPPVVGVDDRFIPGRSIDLYIEDGAGGSARSAGDHLYKEMKEDRRLEGGMWGIFRVLDADEHDRDAPVKPLPK